MKNLRWLILSGLVGLMMTFGSIAVADQSGKPDIQRLRKLFSDNDIKSIRLLFIQQAKSASLIDNADKKGCYLLKLTHLRPRVLYFTDQPRKLAGHLSVASFIYILKNNQTHYQIKPNVAVEGFVGKYPAKEIFFVLNLSNPKYSGAGRHQQVSYTACPLHRDSGIRPMKLKHLNLFFDHLHGFPP